MPHQCTTCGRTFADGSKEMLSGCPECGGAKFQFRPDGFDEGESGVADGQADAAADPGEADSEIAGVPERSGGRRESVARTVGSAASTVKDLVAGEPTPDATTATPPVAEPPTQTGDGSDDDIIIADDEPAHEDSAQADARSAMAGPDDLPAADGDSSSGETSMDASESAASTRAAEATAQNGPGVTSAPTEAGDESAGMAEPPAAAESDPERGSPTNERTVASEPDAERTDRPNLAELRDELNDQFESIRVVEPGQYELNLMELYDREEYIIALQEDGRYTIQVPESWREAEA